MAPLDASAVARLLHEFARRSALRGGNPYRARAYGRAADSLATLTLPLEDLVRQERLRDIPGVGDAIADIITKLHMTGTHPSLEAMRKEVPAGVLDFLAIPGVRPDKALKLYNQLGVTTRLWCPGSFDLTAFLPVILESQNNLPLTKFTPGRARM